LKFIADLHPIIVHFPIAFLLLYIFIEILNLYFKSRSIKKFSLVILIFGVLGGIGSVLTGNLAYQLLETNSSITQLHFSIIEKHEFFASITIWYFLALLIYNTFIFIKKKNESRLRYIFIIFIIFGAFLLYKTSNIGGMLVYKYGIGTDLLK